MYGVGVLLMQQRTELGYHQITKTITKLTISTIAIAQDSLWNMTIVSKALNASAVGFSVPSSSTKYILIGCRGKKRKKEKVRNEGRCVAA